MKRRMRWWALTITAGLVLAVGLTGGTSRADEGPFPGLPALENTPEHPSPPWTNQWSGGGQGGVSQVSRARQWARVPINVAAINNRLTTVSPLFDPEIHRSVILTRNLVYFVSPEGAAHNYGLTPPFDVRTVAFGSVPVVASVQVEQQRDAANLPVPIELEATDFLFRQGKHRPDERFYSDSRVEAAVFVRVVSLAVDGVDVGLLGGCRTRSPGDLVLLGKGAWQNDPDLNGLRPWLSGHYLGSNGGLLSGTLDVPPFGTCRTAGGDDLAPLLSATVSGPDNPVRFNVGRIGACRQIIDGQPRPPGPGMSTPELANCISALMAPLPELPAGQD